MIATCAITIDTVRKMEPKVVLNTVHRHIYEEKVDTIQQRQEQYHKEDTDKLDAILDRLPK